MVFFTFAFITLYCLEYNRLASIRIHKSKLRFLEGYNSCVHINAFKLNYAFTTRSKFIINWVVDGKNVNFSVHVSSVFPFTIYYSFKLLHLDQHRLYHLTLTLPAQTKVPSQSPLSPS